jgi:tetratricopeptide (TPR) repeat protein
MRNLKATTSPLFRAFLPFFILHFAFCISHASSVTVKEENFVIPTYLAGDPEPNPMFYFGRNSQGAEGRVYPYPLYDSLTHTMSNKTYHIVWLENEYVRLGILPEIGGRVFEAVDKSNNYDFIYRQHVIKPALIGLIGAWISGGIEWNIPHHHRASTFLPVQHAIQTNADGGCTVWVGELELRQRMRWAVGYTLHPGKSYLECSVRILNRTPFPNTMLCFANAAVSVNTNYQVIFPPSTQYVTYHGKREFANWPIASGFYSGANFGNGTDVSWYSNHLSANSMFAWNYQDDFFAGYDHGKQAGTLSIADHHFIPGKKFWTWGAGPRGVMWDKILTDSDGPYIELMTGAYSDNQPDYSWLQPYETKSFQMFWYPFRDIDGVKNANLDAAVNLDIDTNQNVVKVGFCTTSEHHSAMATITCGLHSNLLEENISISPDKPYVKQIALPPRANIYDLRASLSVDGRELVFYSPVRLTPMEMPKPFTGPPPPAEIKTVEELYLAGQRIEQFHAPGTASPEPYWEEALRRDPGDARVNTALGIRQLKEARFVEAEQHFRKAIERLSANYTSPKDGEPYYYLGVALKAQDQTKAAEDAFAKAAWSEAWRGPAYFSLAEIATGRADFIAALDDLDRSLDANGLNIRAFNLKAAALRHLGRTNEALAVLDIAAQKTDPLDVRLMAERWLAGEGSAFVELSRAFQDHRATALETAAEFDDAGLNQDATAILSKMPAYNNWTPAGSPLADYFLGLLVERNGDVAGAAAWRKTGSEQPTDYVFPFQWEMIPVLRKAIETSPSDARAPYYLGNLLFDWQPEEALKLWEQSAKLDPSSAIVHRNIATALIHQKPEGDTNRAIAELEKAVACPVKYAMHFAELDELYAATGASPEKRLSLLEQNHDIVAKRDDALSREIGLKVFAGKYEEAIQLMTGRTFSVWEGGTLDVASHWVTAHIGRGRQDLAARQFQAALADLQAAKNIPDNLPNDGRGSGGHEAELNYWIGNAYDGLGDKDKAAQSWKDAQATISGGGGGGGRRGGRGASLDRQAGSYYQALARRALGQTDEADRALHTLLDNASRDLQGESARAASAHYSAGLAHLGLGEKEQARSEFELALRAVPDSLGPKMELNQMR